jgi:hypothetical protein
LRQVESFFFGSGNELFGTYHNALAHSRGHGVLICPPLFSEYYRSHFAIRRIAAELAQKGYDVLRFDYSGTGDSKGAIPPSVCSAWSNEIGSAAHQLRSLGCRVLSVIAARFSASLVLRWRAEFDKYVCWDPIFDPDAYMRQLDATHNASLAQHRDMPEAERHMRFQSDFLGTGVSRATIAESVFELAGETERQAARTLPAGGIDVKSETEWTSPGLQMIYAHDVIKRVSDAF